MAGRQVAAHHVLAHRLGQLQQAQGVGHVAAALADHPRQGVLGAAEALHQHGVGVGLLHRVEIGALDVLDDADLQHLDVLHLAHHDRHLAQAGGLGGAPATFAGDDLPQAGLARLGADQDGLQHPFVADGGGQFVQLGLGEDFARLVGIGLQRLDGRALHARGRRAGRVDGDGLLRVFPQKRRETPAQTTLTFGQDADSLASS
ncbi:hypothetical protein D3C77_313310 [compost metagenome]